MTTERTGCLSRSRRSGSRRRRRSSTQARRAELEELRVRYLGRKAELTQILRGIAQLPPEERGPVGGAANKARKELEALIEQSAERLDAAELDAKLVADRIDVTMPGRAAAAARPPAPDHPDHAADRGHHGRARLRGRRRPGDRARLLQLHRPEPPGRPPGAAAPGHLLHPVPPRRAAAHPHLADADPGDGDAGARRSSSSSPARSTGATPTPPTARCSTRWRGWRSPRG